MDGTNARTSGQTQVSKPKRRAEGRVVTMANEKPQIPVNRQSLIIVAALDLGERPQQRRDLG